MFHTTVRGETVVKVCHKSTHFLFIVKKIFSPHKGNSPDFTVLFRVNYTVPYPKDPVRHSGESLIMGHHNECLPLVSAQLPHEVV